jgi:hypothetical protein
MPASGGRTVVLCLFCAALLLLSPLTASCEEGLVTYRGPAPTMRAFAYNFTLMHTLEGDSARQDRLVIADSYGYVNVLKPSERGFKREWKSFHLGSMVKGLFISDLGNDGKLKLIVFTKDRLFIFDARSHALLWESVESDFTDISCMAIGNFDSSDRHKEMLILAGGVLIIYDGVRYNREWEGTDPYTAQEMVVGDVDGDGEDEVVMNTGFVFGALTHAVEWQTENFGTRLGLIDVDGDGVLEVIGESSGGKLNVYDIDKRQEKQDL